MQKAHIKDGFHIQVLVAARDKEFPSEDVVSFVVHQLNKYRSISLDSFPAPPDYLPKNCPFVHSAREDLVFQYSFIESIIMSDWNEFQVRVFVFFWLGCLKGKLFFKKKNRKCLQHPPIVSNSNILLTISSWN